MSIKVSGRNRFDRTHIINLAESISLYFPRFWGILSIQPLPAERQIPL